MANGPPEEGAYQCFFNRDDLPSPMEGGTLCDFPLAQLSGFPDHEEHFPLYTGARLEDMVESIRRHGVQSPILVWKTAEGTYIIISGHNRVNASKIAGLTTIPAVIRTDLTQETAEDLFYEMNFRQRSLADMLFSQRVLCIAAHYNMLKRQGRRTDLQTFETTSPDTQEKSHTDVKIAQEYELTRDKVSKYCRYATLYRPLLLLMNSGKRLGQLAAYEISFVEDHTTIEYETGLRIIKYETGTEIPISGALFEVIGPDGDSVGTFVTNGDGRIEIPLKKSGNYTVVEREAPQHYMISEEPAQNVTVVYDEVAEVTFFNDPYGTLRIEKKSNTGMNLPGAVITVEHMCVRAARRKLSGSTKPSQVKFRSTNTPPKQTPSQAFRPGLPSREQSMKSSMSAAAGWWTISLPMPGVLRPPNPCL